MGYPARYRPARFRGPSQPGSQGGGGVLGQAGFGPRLAPPTPANSENYFDPLSAALDAAEYVSPRILPRFLGRAIPIIGGALLAYELSQYLLNKLNLNQLGKTQIFMDPSFWYVSSFCSGLVNVVRYNAGWPACGSWPVLRASSPRPTNPVNVWLWWDTGTAYFPGSDFNNMDSGIQYTRKDLGASQLPPYGFPMEAAPYATSPRHFPMPQLNPWRVPIQGPVPEAAPIPIPLPALPNVNPDANMPHEVQWQTGPAPAPRPDNDPYSPWRWEASQGAAPRVHTPARPAPRKPPGRRNKERKVIVSPAASNVIRRVYDVVSEGEDFLDALYWAVDAKKLPPTYWRDPLGNWRKSAPSAIQKANFVYQNIEHVDVGKAIVNVVKNEVSDRFWGRIGRGQAKAARNVHDQGIGSPSRTYTISRRFGSFS